MEEDINVLEKMLKTRKEQKEIIECAGGYCENCNPDIKALENAIQTIKAYKEIKEIEESNRKENGELREKVKQLEKENSLLIQQNITYKINIHDLKHNSIPVSLVEETKNELQDNYINSNNSVSTGNEFIKLEHQLEILDKLLEKR